MICIMGHRQNQCAAKGRLVRAATLVLIFLLGINASSGQEISALREHDINQLIEITADRLEVRQRENIALFIGSVEAVQGDMVFLADELTVFYDPEDTGATPSIARLDARGTVQLSTPSESAESEWGIYDVARRLITLGGDVTLRRGETIIRGDRLELDLTSGVIKFDSIGEGDSEGRVRGRFKAPEIDDGSS